MIEFAREVPPKEIYGSEKPLYFMSFDDFKKEAEIYEKAKASDDWGFLNMVAMLENEKGFDANKIAEPTEMPKEIRDTFVQLLTESVKKRDEVKTVEIAPASKLTSEEVYGLIAAAALKPDFKIEDVELSQASTVSSTKGETCSIRCGYTTKLSESVQHVRLTFTREGSDGKWMLLNFEAV